MPTTSVYPILNPSATVDPYTTVLRSTQCAFVVMAKAPRPGKVKTRLSPPLTLEQAATLNIAFLQDTTQNLAKACGHGLAAGIISYSPVGEESLFDGLLPTGFSLIPQRGESFGERLLNTAEDILACGYGSVCLIDSDSPTVPTAAFKQAIAVLNKPGDRVVLGPSHDGGYYLIGLKRAHAEPFTNINWSTATVADETRARCRQTNLELIELPLWYDVDDGETLAFLTAELLEATPPPFTTQPGYPATNTQAFLLDLHQQGTTTTLDGPHHDSEISAFAQKHELSSSIKPTKPHWHTARPWQTNTALILIGTALTILSTQLVSEYYHFTIGFSGVSGWSATLYIAAVFLILTQPVNRLTLPIILAVAIACRIVPLLHEPYLSSDIYRYVWDGIVQHAHISPYRYVPGDPALAFLRAPHQAIFDHINRREVAPTIYPPIAQIILYLITAISPTITAMKTAMVLFEALTLYALIQILKQLGLRPEQALLYAWCPLVIWEIAGAGHIDSVVIAFITLALLFRLRRRPILTGLFIGLAIMTKFYPIVLLPALLIPLEPRATSDKWAFLNPRNWDWKLPATTFAVIVLSYAAYSSVGLLVFGFLGGYAHEEGMTTGTRYFLLELAQHIPGLQNLPTAAFYIFCILIFAALKIWTYKHNFDAAFQPGAEAAFLTTAFAFAAALMFLFSPHYPWYILWLIPFFTLLPNLPILTYLMAFFYLFTTALADGTIPKMFIVNKTLYGLVCLAVLIHLALRRRTIPGLNFHQRPS
jgi:alpha-1,6-mannosyltransferase